MGTDRVSKESRLLAFYSYKQQQSWLETAIPRVELKERMDPNQNVGVFKAVGGAKTRVCLRFRCGQ